MPPKKAKPQKKRDIKAQSKQNKKKKGKSPSNGPVP
jgi:hypothetical protein